jgi:hypothetical protein
MNSTHMNVHIVYSIEALAAHRTLVNLGGDVGCRDMVPESRGCAERAIVGTTAPSALEVFRPSVMRLG